MTRWTTDDIPDQTGRTIVVTGANSGLGLEMTKALVAKGAHVVMACRNLDKARQAAATVTGPGETSIVELDLVDLDQVRATEGSWPASIDVLICNAGIMHVPMHRTPQGHESQFGVNVLGHFLLTAMLMPRITDRVTAVSSLMHRVGTIDLSDLDWRRRRFLTWRAYGQSKLANLMLALELQRRLATVRSPVRSTVAHPGYAATELQTRSTSLLGRAVGLANRTPAAQSAEMGALPLLYAATVPDIRGGAYVGPGGAFEVHGHPRLVGMSGRAHDVTTAAALFDRCEELVGMQMRLPQP